MMKMLVIFVLSLFVTNLCSVVDSAIWPGLNPGCGALGIFDNGTEGAKKIEEKETAIVFKLYPIGNVEKRGKQVRLRVFEKYTDAIKGLDEFSHVFVLYWFDRNDTPQNRSILQVRPRGNKKNPLTGVFACRSPVRPNLIALSLCRILSIKDEIIFIDKIDAFDNSPILDLKPYIPLIDSRTKDVRLPNWLRKIQKR